MKVSQCPSRSLTTRVSQVPDSVVADVPAATPLLKVYDSGPSGPAFYLLFFYCATHTVGITADWLEIRRDLACTQLPATLSRSTGQLVQPKSLHTSNQRQSLTKTSHRHAEGAQTH